MEEIKRRILAELLPKKKYWKDDGLPRVEELNYAAGLQRDIFWADEVYFPAMFRYTRMLFNNTPPERRADFFGEVEIDSFGVQIDITDDDLLLELQYRMDAHPGWKQNDKYPESMIITPEEIAEMGIVPNDTQIRLF